MNRSAIIIAITVQQAGTGATHTHAKLFVTQSLLITVLNNRWVTNQILSISQAFWDFLSLSKLQPYKNVQQSNYL
jgi:hypothetical protein